MNVVAFVFITHAQLNPREHPVMKRGHVFPLSFVVLACLYCFSAISDPINLGASKPDAAAGIIIEEAIADFQAVLSGNKPIHAKIDKMAPLPADGGTSFYKTEGYSLTVMKSLVRMGGVHGFMYGPIIRFGRSVAIGNSNQISQVGFYSRDELVRLLKK